MSTGKTYTPSFNDTLVHTCGGECNAAALAARIAAFIKGSATGGSVTLTIKFVCDIYGWSEYKLHKYADILIKVQILDVKFGAFKGTQTIWSKGAKFDTFFSTPKGQNFLPFNDTQRVKTFEVKGQNFSPLRYTKINNNYNNIKEKFACGAVISFDQFYTMFGTTDESALDTSRFGKWEKITNPLPVKYRRVQ